MLTVLVTGSMGAGKSSAVTFLKLKSYPVFQADVRAKELLRPQSPCYHRLKQLFGEKCLSGNSEEFDTRKLAQEIFKYPEKRKIMEAVIHPLVRKSFKEFVKDQEKQTKSKVFYEIPLISHDVFDCVDKCILLVCPKDVQKKRLIKKGWTAREIEQRWAAQIPESQIIDKVDFVINNKGNLENLHIQIEKVLSLMDKGYNGLV